MLCNIYRYPTIQSAVNVHTNCTWYLFDGRLPVDHPDHMVFIRYDIHGGDKLKFRIAYWYVCGSMYVCTVTTGTICELPMPTVLVPNVEFWYLRRHEK
jgi:hypothetical protein